MDFVGLWIKKIGVTESLLILLGSHILIDLIVASIGAFILKCVSNVKFLDCLFLIFAVSLLGSVSGILGGMSRSGVVGNTLPAVFTAIGAGLGVLFSKNNLSENFSIKKRSSSFAAISVICFSVVFGFSYLTSAQLRGERDYIELCLSTLSNPEVLSSDVAWTRFNRSFRVFCAGAFGTEAESQVNHKASAINE